MPGVRCLPLEAAFNVRDLGGYATSDGRTVRWGLVYRGDSLHLLTASDQQVIGSLGLRAIYDLRRLTERTRYPTALPESHGHRDVHLDVFDDPDASPGPELLDRLKDRSFFHRPDQEMIDTYVTMLVEGAPVFGTLLTALATGGGVPALFHCAAGKDRTGVAAALLLTVLGVDEETTIKDYGATNVYRTTRYVERVRPAYAAADVDVEQIRHIVRARPTVLAGALKWIHAEHGSIENYLTERAGTTSRTLERLRGSLLD